MPELPEVETIVRDLRPVLKRRKITGVSRLPTKMRRAEPIDWTGSLVGLSWKRVTRRGKWIVNELSADCHLLIHLGMTGQLQVQKMGGNEIDHLHLQIELDNGKCLQFRDVRRFGAVRFLTAEQALATYFDEEGLGPEPFQVDPAYWFKRLNSSQRNLKALLLDQGIVAGVGNIYADEALFRARLAPVLRGCDLKPAQAESLRLAVEEVLQDAISKRGSTIRDYIGGSGLKGGFQNNLRVYGRTGDPCVRCSMPVAKIDLAGRSTHFCPRCQVGNGRQPLGSKEGR